MRIEDLINKRNKYDKLARNSKDIASHYFWRGKSEGIYVAIKMIENEENYYLKPHRKRESRWIMKKEEVC